MVKLKSKLLLALLIFTLITSIFCINVLATDIEGINDDEITDIAQGENESTSENPISEGEIQARTSDEGIEATSDDGYNYGVESEEIHEGDLYVLYGENDYNSTSYTMDKNVDGNVFIVGQDVKIAGQINGSLFVFAKSVTIEEDAYIACHTFIAAGDIIMKGFTSDMYAAAENFTLVQDAIIYRDLKLGANKVTLRGGIGRDLYLAASDIDVFEDEENCVYIGGNLKYTSGKEIENLDKLEMTGEVSFTKEAPEEKETTKASDYVYKAIENIVFALVVYAVMMFLAPKFIEKSKGYVSTKGLLSIAIGLGFTIITPILAFILLFTGIGIGVSFTLIMIYFVILMVNSAIVTIVANEFIASKVSWVDSIWKKLLMIVPVSLVIFLIRQIPILGGWITAIVLFAGVGIAILYQFNKREKEIAAE